MPAEPARTRHVPTRRQALVCRWGSARYSLGLHQLEVSNLLQRVFLDSFPSLKTNSLSVIHYPLSAPLAALVQVTFHRIFRALAALALGPLVQTGP